MNLLWAFDFNLPKDANTGLRIPLDTNDTTDVGDPVFPKY